MFAHNKLSDWNQEEYDKLLGLKNMPLDDMPDSSEEIHDKTPTYTVPEVVSNGSINWCSTSNPQSSNKCTPIRDQGPCGSCYTFSAIAAIEPRFAIATTSTVKAFSEQQLVSCSSP